MADSASDDSFTQDFPPSKPLKKVVPIKRKRGKNEKSDFFDLSTSAPLADKNKGFDSINQNNQNNQENTVILTGPGGAKKVADSCQTDKTVIYIGSSDASSSDQEENQSKLEYIKAKRKQFEKQDVKQSIPVDSNKISPKLSRKRLRSLTPPPIFNIVNEKQILPELVEDFLGNNDLDLDPELFKPADFRRNLKSPKKSSENITIKVEHIPVDGEIIPQSMMLTIPKWESIKATMEKIATERKLNVDQLVLAFKRFLFL